MTIQDKALQGSVALVTGGSRGIGRAVCVALARRGARVAVNYVAREEAARETAELVRQAGGDPILCKFDVGDGAASAEAIKKLVVDCGRLDILVNNAGIAINGLLLRFKAEDWDKVMSVNLASAFHCTKAASSALLKAKERGRVINVSSVVGDMGNAGQAAYAASKAGLIGVTKALAREFASRGVTVNAVAPGYIETDMTASELPEASRQKMLAEIPLARVGKPEEVGDVVAFLAGPEASYITGHVLRVNGGLYM